MSARRFSRLQKATALVPLAILSAAWTANMAGLMPNPAAVAVNKTPSPATLPDGSPLPAAPLQTPASITVPDDHSQPVATKGRSGGDLISSVSATGIPAAALVAYQRATTVINDADPTCHLDWPLLAAIGRVESNHGRVGGSQLTAAGIATPAILGPALTGRHGTSRVVDTDGGTYDGDRSIDRAVGPMQFIPSTWAIVGVDGDGDGKRDPQDINDAALATAVYLCSGSNLSSLAGQRAAVYRYNHSHPYVATVLGIAAAYRAGDYTSVQTDVVPGGDLIVPTSEPLYARPNGPEPAHHRSSPHPQAPASGTSTIPVEQPPAAAGGKTHHADTSPQDQAGDTDDTTKTKQPPTGSDASAQPTENPGAPPTQPTDNPSAPPTQPTDNPSAPPTQPTDNPSAPPTQPTDNPSAEPSQPSATDDPSEPPTLTGTPTDGDATISGTGEPGATVTVLVNRASDGTATVAADGSWTATLNTPIVAGNEVTATQEDPAGNTSTESEPVTVAPTDTPSDSASSQQ